jgi:DNA-binding Lrp family transcriptional regulator
MNKPDPSSPSLTENDKKVLKKIIEYSKIPDSEIATSMEISPQAVFKIRGKLEKLGIIKGYIPIIDFQKIGVNIMTILIIRLTADSWNKHSDTAISERITHNPHVIEAYRVADANASHILLLGFRDSEHKEKYIRHIQTKYSKEIEIKDVYTFPVNSRIVHNPIGLLHEIINKTDISDYDFFPK